MLTGLAITGTVIAISLLVLRPAWGVVALMLVRPLVDTQWRDPLLFGLKLTEIVSVLVPVIVLWRMALDSDRRTSIGQLPLRGIWMFWAADVAFFSAAIAYSEGAIAGLSIFFRHLNGLAGFYMIQAYCARDSADTRRFVWALALAGLFPVGTGLVEAISGHHWNLTYGENGVVRGIGLYHDAITIRYYGLQTILGLLLLSSLYLGRNLLSRALVVAYGLAAAFVIQRAYSKAGTLTLVLWASLWPALRRRYRQLAAVAGVALAAATWYGPQLMQTIGFIFHKEIGALEGTTSVEHVFSGRWYLWEDMLREWQGFGIFAKVFGSGQVATGAHNDYLQVLFHGGLVAIAIYLLLLGLTFARIVRNLVAGVDEFRVAALLVFVMWLVDTVGLVPSAYSGYQWLVWGVIGLSFRFAVEGATQPQPGVQSAAPVPIKMYVRASAEPGGLMR